MKRLKLTQNDIETIFFLVLFYSAGYESRGHIIYKVDRRRSIWKDIEQIIKKKNVLKNFPKMLYFLPTDEKIHLFTDIQII